MASIWNTIQNLFVPHDNLRTQAQNLINQYDSHGDGQINTAALQAAGPQAMLAGVPAGTFIAADAEGNSNGKANLKEIRNHLKEFDTGPYGNNDKTLDGVEQLQMQANDAQYSMGGFGMGGYGGVGGYGGFFRGSGYPSAGFQAQFGAGFYG